MRLHGILFVLGVLVAALGVTPASTQAQVPKVPTLIVKNGTTYPVWVTIYSATIFDKRDIVCSGWADPGKGYQCTFIHFSSFPTYYARGEVMQHGNPKHILCDTHGQMYGSPNEKVSIIRYNGHGCWVDKGRAS